MTTVSKQQIIGKVISLVNNEDPNYTTKLFFVTSCESKENNNFYLGGIMMEISKENPSIIDNCRSNFIEVVSAEELKKLNQNSQHINQFVNGIYDRSITEIISMLDKQSKIKFTIALQKKFGNRYAEIKTISNKELVVWVDTICYITEIDGDCIVLTKIKTHLMNEETEKYKIEEFTVPVTLSEIIK